jgi:hypothetical protein
MTRKFEWEYALKVVWPGAWLGLLGDLCLIVTLGWWGPNWNLKYMFWAIQRMSNDARTNTSNAKDHCTTSSEGEGD